MLSEHGFETLLQEYTDGLVGRSKAFIDRSLLLVAAALEAWIDAPMWWDDWEDADAALGELDKDPVLLDLQRRFLAYFEGEGGAEDDPIVVDFDQRLRNFLKPRPDVPPEEDRIIQQQYSKAVSLARADSRRRQVDVLLVKAAALSLASAREVGANLGQEADAPDSAEALRRLCDAIWTLAHTVPFAGSWPQDPGSATPPRKRLPAFWAIPSEVLRWIERIHDMHAATWRSPADLGEARRRVTAELNRWNEAAREGALFIDERLRRGARGGDPDMEVSVVDEHTLTKPYGWVFSWNFTRYLETGDFHHMAIGNGPVIFESATRRMTHTGTGVPEEWYISRFEKQRKLS